MSAERFGCDGSVVGATKSNRSLIDNTSGINYKIFNGVKYKNLDMIFQGVLTLVYSVGRFSIRQYKFHSRINRFFYCLSQASFFVPFSRRLPTSVYQLLAITEEVSIRPYNRNFSRLSYFAFRFNHKRETFPPSRESSHLPRVTLSQRVPQNTQL